MRKEYLVSVIPNDGVKPSEVQAAIREALAKLSDKVTIRPAGKSLGKQKPAKKAKA
jgi:hypothetical protein